MSETGQDIEAKARALGWRPQTEFKGDPKNFVDAATFVERGEQMLPIIKAEKRELEGRVQQTEGELAQTRQALNETREALEGMKEFRTEMTREKNERKKTELVGKIREAREAGNVEREMELQGELNKLGQPEAAKPGANGGGGTRREPPASGEELTTTKWWKDWIKDNNDWFGVDARRTNVAMAIAQELRIAPATRNLPPEQFLQKLSSELDSTVGPVRRAAASKVEGSGGGEGGGGGGGQGKSFADLPADAQAACDRAGKRVVGANRAYKTQDEWRKQYVKEYFED